MSDDEHGDESLARSRSRRSRNDKSGRAAALEKLKNLRGSKTKNKYEVADVKNVYDVVDEDEYVERVNGRLKDDWIIDDGTGYCENGLEVFDDDIADDEDIEWRRGAKAKKEAKSKKKPSKEETESARAGFQSLRSMLQTMPQKRKRNENGESSRAGVKEDDLGDLMQELHEDKKPRINPSSSKFLEVTTAREKMLESSRIKESSYGAPSSSKAIAKKKFQAFKVSEPTSGPVEIKLEVEEDNGYDNGDGVGDEDAFFPDDDLLLLESSNITEQHVKASLERGGKNTTHHPSTSAGKTGDRQANLAVAIKKEAPKVEYDVNSMNNFEAYVKTESTASIADSSDQALKFMITQNQENEQVLNFYWLDMSEEPRNPGSLYIFGKVQTSPQNYASCCVVLKNVERVVYLLPKENVAFTEVHAEFNDVISTKYNIRTFKCRPIGRKYCFGLPDIPTFAEYLEVRYSGAMPALPDDLTGETFCKVFGSTNPLMEHFLLEKQLKGPSWLQITKPLHVQESGQQHSWCKFEFIAEVGDVSISSGKDKKQAPPLVVASINLQTVPDADAKKDIIVGAGVAVNHRFDMGASLSKDGYFHDHFILLNKPPGCVWPFDLDKYMNKHTFKFDSERSMLGLLLAKLQKIDADAYVGHDMNFEMLLFHLVSHKVANWSRIGRLKRSTHMQKSGKMLDTKSLVAGRLVCDVKTSAMELIRARSYDLNSLATQVLGCKEDYLGTYVGPEIKMFFDSSEGIRHFIGWSMEQCVINIKLVNELQVLPLASQITAIAGNTLSRTLLGGRSERNEFLLLHAFYAKEYIVPNKYNWSAKKIKAEQDEGANKKGGKSSGPSYAGGLVLDPKKGFYDNFIVLMDFNSLYPSIIQEFNVCFTTSISDDNFEQEQKGVLPEEIRKLVESRRTVKRLMQGENVSPQQKIQYDIRQKALKLTANSMYGCLGFRNSRFYAKDLAAFITGKGREILLRTKDTVEKLGFEVIYGDTDSIMINSNSQDVQKVYQIGNKIKGEINRQYRLLELEIDGIFRFMLLLKKKKYAALIYNQKPNGAIETTLELKGLDMVRRDWAPVAGQTAKLILDEIMTEQVLDDKIYKAVKILNDVAKNLRAGEVPLKDLLITKQLAKHPEEYKDPQGLYHVQVALRMNKSGKLPKKFRNGDTVSYIFCNDNLAHHLSEVGTPKLAVKDEIKAEVKDEPGPSGDSTAAGNGNQVKVEGEQETLQPDPLYYLSQQIHPVVSRICEPIPGLDAARIAECLGMDPTSFRRRRVVEVNPDDQFLQAESYKEKFRDCEKFTFKCPEKACKKEVVFESAFTGSDSDIKFSLETCPGCNKNVAGYVNHICNTLTLFIRRKVGQFYKNVSICEDPSCPHVDRRVTVNLVNNFIPCRCKEALLVKEYSNSDLNKQLSYLHYLFDVEKQMEGLTTAEKVIIEKRMKEGNLRDVMPAFAKLIGVVQKTLDKSAYSVIPLGNLFENSIPNRGLFA